MVVIKNRPLTYQEKKKYDENEQKVIDYYEWLTKRSFMRFDVIILKRMLKNGAYPEQIISQIKRFHSDKRYSENFSYFGYIEQPVNFMFKRQRGGKGK